jgi:hypothetical protein
MADSLASRVHQTEPALFTGGLTGLMGFLAQAGPAGIDSLEALGTAASISGVQGLLTRQRVYAPATAKAEIAKGLNPMTPAPAPFRQPAINRAEPALAMALVGFLIGFLLQIAGGVDAVQALLTAAGIAATQGALTRERVHAPQTVARMQWATTRGRLATATALSPGGRVGAPK